MRSQQSTYSRPDRVDFSSTLMQAAAAEKSSARNRSDKAAGVPPFEEYDPYNNRNLSSVLSRITDEGPANLQKKEGVSQNKNSYHAGPAETIQVPDDRYNTAIPSNDIYQRALPQSFAKDEAGISNDTEQVSQQRSSKWQQLVLLLLVSVIAVMGFVLYQLTLQTDKLSNTLILNEEQILLASNTQKLPPEVQPRLNSLNDALSELKEELQDIKVGYQESDSRLALNIPRELQPRLMKLAAASDDVSALKNEFERIQNEMREMGTDIKVIKQEIAPEQIPEQIPEQMLNPGSGLVVNLASLTSKDRAQAAIEKLQQSGVTPVIQDVVVNGKKVYRISVDGFTTRELASAFIIEARENYGFDGGWIRQN